MEEIREKSILYEGLKHYFIVNFPQRPGAILSFIRDIIGPTDELVYIQYIKQTNKEEGPGFPRPSQKDGSQQCTLRIYKRK